jgi:hypothetical protein
VRDGHAVAVLPAQGGVGAAAGAGGSARVEAGLGTIFWCGLLESVGGSMVLFN